MSKFHWFWSASCKKNLQRKYTLHLIWGRFTLYRSGVGLRSNHPYPLMTEDHLRDVALLLFASQNRKELKQTDFHGFSMNLSATYSNSHSSLPDFRILTSMSQLLPDQCTGFPAPARMHRDRDTLSVVLYRDGGMAGVPGSFRTKTYYSSLFLGGNVWPEWVYSPYTLA